MSEDRSRIYMAAPVPRSIRSARLSHLPTKTVIGCWATKADNQVNFVYDLIMLPEDQFNRAKSYLAVSDMSSPSLQMMKFAPPFVVKDVRTVTVPDNEADPYSYAKDYFLNAFGLDKAPG